MGLPALATSPEDLAPRELRLVIDQPHPHRPNVIPIAITLILLQFLDGFFTALGVLRYGTWIEGNVLLREAMEIFGTIPTLAATKGLAILIIFGLVYLARHVVWVPRAMRWVAALYVIAAIIPWSVIHLRHLVG